MTIARPLTPSGDRIARTPTVADKVHARLRQRLLVATWPPGTRLRESELATSFGVSRTPVREAFKQLQQEGLLEAHPTQGVRVRRPGLQEALDAYDVRTELEGMAARLAAERATPRQRASLAALLKRMEMDDPLDEAAQIEADLAFHRRVAELAGNAALLRALDMLEGHVTPVKVVTRDRNASSDTREQHQAVAHAISVGDGSAAEAAMQRHVQHFRSIVAERFAHDPSGGAPS